MHLILCRKEQYSMEFIPYAKYPPPQESIKKDQKLMPESIPKIYK
jgi:hypothetical protein